MAISILEVTSSSAIPQFAPFGVLYYAQDTGDLWIGTGFSTGSDYDPSNPGPNVNAELIASGSGGAPGGFNGDIQYNNLGAFGGSAATVDALGNISALSVTATTATITNEIATTATVTTDHVTNSTIVTATVTSTLELQTATIVDSLGSTGTVGQALESTGTGVIWAAVSSTETWAALTGAMTYTQVAPWYNATSTVDSGISRLGAASLAIGNGTAGDTSGSLTLKTLTISDTGANADLILENPTAATALTLNQSPLLEFSLFYDHAGTSTLDTWTIGSGITVAGSNGPCNLTLQHPTGTPGSAFVEIIGVAGQAGGITSFVVTDNSSATFRLSFNGASDIEFSGNVSAHDLVFGGKNGPTTGSPFTELFRVSNISSAIRIASTLPLQWSTDSGISRLGAASLAIGNGTAGNSSGTLLASVHGFGATVTSTTPDTGISRLSAGVIGVGTGATTSTAGSLIMTTATVSSTLYGGVYWSAGNAGVTQAAEAVGTIATTGGIVTTFTAVSDERLKISTSYLGGLEELLGITPIRYRWNAKGQELSGQTGDRDYIGFSAQNVEKSIPEAIQSKKGPEQYLSFDDRPVIAAAVNAIKELAAENKELRKRLDALEAR